MYVCGENESITNVIPCNSTSRFLRGKASSIYNIQIVQCIDRACQDVVIATGLIGLVYFLHILSVVGSVLILKVMRESAVYWC